ncbi:MAG: hypothetical protein BGO87_13070 [Flavobacteriia bacterium 40-80]|nr:MAG: hypothetical protein BGO87_13070 [Flavobacteriia bacterium 40-80]
MTNAEIENLITKNLPSNQQGYITAEKLREVVRAIAEMTLQNILERGNLTNKDIEVTGNKTASKTIGFNFDSFGNNSKVGVNLTTGQPSIEYNESSFRFDDSKGIDANEYYGEEYTDNTYIQKKYIDENFKPALQTFILQQPLLGNYSWGPLSVPMYGEDLGGGLTIRPKLPMNLDVDLSKGNYAAICLGVVVKSLELPNIYKDSLTYLELLTGTYTLDNIINLKLSDYPNLAAGYIHPGNRVNKHHTIKIIDDVIDLPRIGGLQLGGSKRVPWCVTNPDLTFKMYRDMNISLCSTTLENLVLDFSTLKPSGIYMDGPFSFPELPYYRGHYSFSPNSNLKNVIIHNLPSIHDTLNSEFRFYFSDCNLTQESVDHILHVLNTQFPNTFPDDYPRMEVNLQSQQEKYLYAEEGVGLIIGNTYRIDSISDNDNFSNVGFVQAGVPFVATETIPTKWSASTVYAMSCGPINKIQVVSTGIPLPDGGYSCNGIWTRWESGVIVELDIQEPYSTEELNRTIVLEYFSIASQEDPSVIIWGNDSDAYDITVKVTGVSKNSAPTGGTSNPDYLELLAKNWTVSINS